ESIETRMSNSLKVQKDCTEKFKDDAVSLYQKKQLLEIYKSAVDSYFDILSEKGEIPSDIKELSEQARFEYENHVDLKYLITDLKRDNEYHQKEIANNEKTCEILDIEYKTLQTHFQEFEEKNRSLSQQITLFEKILERDNEKLNNSRHPTV